MKLAFVFAVIFLISSPSACAQQASQLVDRIVAVVNNEVITQSEFDLIFMPLYEQMKENLSSPEFQKEIGGVRLKLLNQMIEDKLVYQEAKKLGIEVSEADVQKQLEKFKAQFSDPKTYEEELRLSGLTEEMLLKQFRERISITRFHQYLVRGKAVVSPGEVEQYYREHVQDLAEKEQLEVWSITIRKNAEAAQRGITDEKAKALIEQIKGLLQNGRDFGSLAEKYSEDASAQNSGYVGFVEAGHFFKELNDLLFSLSENSISDVIESERGYHLFKVGRKKGRVEKSFEESREKIEDELFRQKAHERFVSWMEDLKKQAYISVR